MVYHADQLVRSVVPHFAFDIMEQNCIQYDQKRLEMGGKAI